jgi:hypothetical protein
MDIIDQANDVAEQMLRAQLTIRKPSSLLPAGACHYCDEPLKNMNQLFCDADCREDHENEDRLRKQAGKIG